MNYKTISKPLLILCFMFFLKGNVFAQQTTVTKKDGQILASVKDVSVGMFNANSEEVDPNGLMSSFDITIHWRTLLGEPIEKYDFTWYSTGKFVIGGKTITKGMLSKYPDLLKRFNNLSPYRVWVFVEGYQNPIFTSASVPDFIYLVDHLKILQNKSGVKGDGIVGGSPHWNEFLDWDHNSIERFASSAGVGYQKGSRSDKNLLRKNKNNFAGIEKVALKPSLYKVEWHEYELKGIAETYAKYESGELNPEDASDDLNDLLSGGGEEDCGDDLDAMLSGCGKETAVEFDIEWRDGKEGVVAKDGRILIPFKEWDITEYDPQTGTATVEDFDKEDDPTESCFNDDLGGSTGVGVYYETSVKRIVDNTGKDVISPEKTATVAEWGPKTYTRSYYPESWSRDRKDRYQEKWSNSFRNSCRSIANTKINNIANDLISKGFEVKKQLWN